MSDGIGIEGFPVMLEDMADGGAVEHFNEGINALKRDLEVAGKKPDATRSFCLKFTLKPGEEGTSARLYVELTAVKLAPGRAYSAGLIIRRRGEQMELLELKQEDHTTPGTLPFKQGED